MLIAESFPPDDLTPLPAAAAFIEIDHQLDSVASVVVGDATKVSLASLDGTPPTPDEVIPGNEDMGSVDENSVGDDTILADEAVLTVNEVEEVLRDAFAEADQFASIINAQGAAPVGDDLTPDLSGPLLGCTGIPHHLICRGASYPQIT